MSVTQHKESVDRRKHWRDRRDGGDRRNLNRSAHETYDCRSGVPRREADIAGILDDADVWWDQDFYADLKLPV